MIQEFTMSRDELLSKWNAVQIKINVAISKGQWRDIDHYTTVTTGLIKQMSAEGHDDLIQQVLSC